MKVAVVMPVGAGRAENAELALDSLALQTHPPSLVAVACDGPEAALRIEGDGYPIPAVFGVLPKKHEPGMEQPRNIGVRIVEQMGEFSHVLFLDSDVILAEDALEKYHQAMDLNPEPRILVGPYDWLPPGVRHPLPGHRDDVRWPSFDSHEPEEAISGDLSAGLAGFSGNLCWPIEDFKRVGGFWNELHHGRCEDGELGLRAVAMGMAVSYVRGARGWHLWHGGAPQPTPEYMARVTEMNAIDVPKLNERHPWKELGEGGFELFMVEEDGRRFNARCSNCGLAMNSALVWRHLDECARP